MEDREVWRLNLELLPRNPHGKAGNEEKSGRVDRAFANETVASGSNPGQVKLKTIQINIHSFPV